MRKIMPDKRSFDERFAGTNMLSFPGERANYPKVRAIFFAVAFLTLSLHAQNSPPAKSEAVAELDPMVISGSFELQKRPVIIDLVIKDLELQFDQKRKAAEEVARAPFWNARLWQYIPIRLGPGDDEQFFTPSYLTLANQDSVRALEFSKRHPLFDSPRDE
jgi:hypothetical protein